MTNKKKVLFFLWSFSLGGGAEKILATLANHLDKDKYEIDILEMEHFDKGYEQVSDNINILNAWQDYRQARWKRAILWRLRRYFPYFVRKRLVKDVYDIEVSFTIMNPPLPFSKRENVKKIAWIHGSIESFLLETDKRLSHRAHLSHADAIVGISDKTCQSIIEVYPEFKNKVHKIYNGYNLAQLRENSLANAMVSLAENSICTIGRIEEQKGSADVLRVLAQLHAQNAMYHLYFIGTGALEETLKATVAQKGLNDYVHFLGYQTNPLPYLRQASVLLSMSKQEGFSGVCIEALSLGVPFVSTNVGGASELAQYGYIIDTPEQAAEAILHLQPKVAADTFMQQFTIDKQVENVEALFENKESL